MPSSFTLIHLAFNNPSPKDITVPSFTLLPGLTKHDQISSLIFFKSNMFLMFIW